MDDEREREQMSIGGRVRERKSGGGWPSDCRDLNWDRYSILSHPLQCDHVVRPFTKDELLSKFSTQL